jgi:hypothetical protein
MGTPEELSLPLNPCIWEQCLNEKNSAITGKKRLLVEKTEKLSYL